ncbi:hypothetical protein QAD02_023462 [Eretmocerus hayati]|uniref:Uncharacterized protein n=1 Tax=Eretmocerus hayati TaxID=131215 RepID=A0ACC2PW00_9HYME|nr:hypothetical protein QAD02_023462 [Eretmocerus hayati]
MTDAFTKLQLGAWLLSGVVLSAPSQNDPQRPSSTVAPPKFLSYQDSKGLYSFGYSSPDSARSEYRTADGLVRGSFSYVDEFGRIRTTEYEAGGPAGGFRIRETNPALAQSYLTNTPLVSSNRLAHQQLLEHQQGVQQNIRNQQWIPQQQQQQQQLDASRVTHQHGELWNSRPQQNPWTSSQQIQQQRPNQRHQQILKQNNQHEMLTREFQQYWSEPTVSHTWSRPPQAQLQNYPLHYRPMGQWQNQQASQLRQQHQQSFLDQRSRDTLPRQQMYQWGPNQISFGWQQRSSQKYDESSLASELQEQQQNPSQQQQLRPCSNQQPSEPVSTQQEYDQHAKSEQQLNENQSQDQQWQEPKLAVQVEDKSITSGDKSAKDGYLPEPNRVDVRTGSAHTVSLDPEPEAKDSILPVTSNELRAVATGASHASAENVHSNSVIASSESVANPQQNVIPQPVVYTPEVMAAREAHFRAYDSAARLAIEADANPDKLQELLRNEAVPIPAIQQPVVAADSTATLETLEQNPEHGRLGRIVVAEEKSDQLRGLAPPFEEHEILKILQREDCHIGVFDDQISRFWRTCMLKSLVEDVQVGHECNAQELICIRMVALDVIRKETLGPLNFRELSNPVILCYRRSNPPIHGQVYAIDEPGT